MLQKETAVRKTTRRKKARWKRVRTLEDIVLDTINYLVLIFILLVTLYPFYYILIMSFNQGLDAMRGGIYLFPRAFTLENYTSFLKDPLWLNAILVTSARTVLGTVLTVLLTCLVAYGLSFKELINRRLYMLLLIVSLYFSGGLIPYYVVLKFLGLINSFWVYIFPGMLNLFFVLVAISFFQEIPKELRESCLLDGAGELRIFLRLVIPVSTPLIATIALFTGVGHWNSWFDSAFFVPTRNNLRTLGYVLVTVINKSQMSGSATSGAAGQRMTTTTNVSIRMTAMMIATAPIICAYPFLQRFFVKGILIGSVKG
jgi:putative aldouronate transport system permease protein